MASLLVVAWATLTPDGAVRNGTARACLSCGASRFTDAAANVLLFVPLGGALVLVGAGVARASLIALLVTIAIECAQLVGVPSGRVASLSDLLCNAAGALIGATIARRRAVLLAPHRSHAGTLALSWSGIVAALLLATGWLVGDPHSMRASSTALPHISPLPFTPGFGWFEGRVTHAVVDGAEFAQNFNGPLMVETNARGRYSATLWATGRDSRTTPVPMLFVHRVADTLPVLMIAQRGADYLLRGDSRATRFGFAPPDLIVTGKQMGLDGGRATAFPRSSVSIGARTTSRSLTLTVRERGARHSVEMLRTAAVSWALVQSLVPLSTPYSSIVTCTWLCLLLMPLGYWGWLSGPRRALVSGTGALCVSVSLWIGVQAFGIAYPPPLELVAMITGLLLGFVAGRLSAASSP